MEPPDAVELALLPLPPPPPIPFKLEPPPTLGGFGAVLLYQAIISLVKSSAKSPPLPPDPPGLFPDEDVRVLVEELLLIKLSEFPLFLVGVRSGISGGPPPAVAAELLLPEAVAGE